MQGKERVRKPNLGRNYELFKFGRKFKGIFPEKRKRIRPDLIIILENCCIIFCTIKVKLTFFKICFYYVLKIIFIFNILFLIILYAYIIIFKIILRKQVKTTKNVEWKYLVFSILKKQFLIIKHVFYLFFILKNKKAILENNCQISLRKPNYEIPMKILDCVLWKYESKTFL